MSALFFSDMIFIGGKTFDRFTKPRNDPGKLTSSHVDLILLLDLSIFPFSQLQLHYFQSFLLMSSGYLPFSSVISDLQILLQIFFFSLLSEIYFEALRIGLNHFHSFKLENQTNI